MSRWTKVSGVINVETFGKTTFHSLSIVDSVLAHLPKIEGSEGPAAVFVNQERKPNYYSSHNELYELARNFEATTTAIITLTGSLRDVSAKEMYRQIIKWLNRLSRRICVETVTISVSDRDNSFIIHDPQYILETEVDSSWIEGYQELIVSGEGKDYKYVYEV